MTDLSDSDVERIAQALAARLKQTAIGRDFWIEPEQHYRDHLFLDGLKTTFDAETRGALKEMAEAFRAGRKRSLVIFLIMVAIVIGSLLIAWYALFHQPSDIVRMLEK